MSNNDILKQLQGLGQAVDFALNGREFFLGDIIDRLNKAASRYPHDQSVLTMKSVLEKRFKREGSISVISQSDFQKTYDQLSGLGNHTIFTEELGDLLLVDRVAKVASYNSDFINGIRDSGDMLEFANEGEITHLASLWSDDPNAPVLKSAFIDNGRKGISIELEAFGFSNPNVEVVEADNDFVIYAAEMDTKRGRIPVLIPAEVKQGTVLMPSVFVAGNSFKELTVANLKTYINETDLNTKASTSKAILDTLHRLTGSKSTFEKSATLAVDDSFADITPIGPELYSDPLGHTDQNLRGPMDIQMPKVNLPPELQEIGESLIKETLVEAGLSYPRDVVLSAKKILVNELRIAGIVHDTISVESEFSKGINLATNITGKGGKKRIEVPIEIVGSTLLMPKAFTSGAFAGKFDDESLKSFASRIEGAAFDPFLTDKADMSFAELNKMSLSKASYGNFIEATEALTVISSKFGHEFYKMAHNDLMNLMSVGYSQKEKPLSDIELFAKEAAKATEQRAERIMMMDNPMLFYPAS